MRKIRTVVVVMACTFALALPAPTAAQKAPVDFELPKADGSPGPVTFSHEKHKEGAETCTACHTKIFKMKKGTTGGMTMAKMGEGQSCGTCHNGKTEIKGKKVFDANDGEKCATCHKSK
jgi:c(7)-type cytochrome triheme protein